MNDPVPHICRTCTHWGPRIFVHGEGSTWGKCFVSPKPEPPTYGRDWDETCEKWKEEDKA